MRFKHLIVVSCCLAAVAACDNQRPSLRFVTPVSPMDRAIAEDLVDLFANERVSTIIRLTDTALSETAALDAIAAGRADIALVSNSLDYRRDVTTVMPLYATVLHIAQHKEAASTGAPLSLRGASVYAGADGSASRLMFERIAERLGIGSSEFRYVEDPGDPVDVVVVFAPISPDRIEDFPDFVLTSLGNPDDIGAGSVLDAAVLLNPHFRPFVVPVGTYGDATPEPIATIAVDKMLVTRSDLDSSVVYDLINDILRLRPVLAAQRPGLFHHLSEHFDASRSRFVLHAGTQAFLQRSAPTIYERYSGVAEVFVTLIVALVSATIAGIRIFRMRRKNRIDEFYSRTIALRRSVTASSDPAELRRVRRDVRELQAKAFDLLVDEKLAADESFRIFITLSNDVLRQLGDSDGDRDRRLSDS
jgi:TRAP-type uncharacterized transport system substrate-binding protein